MVPEELGTNTKTERFIYQTTTAQVIRATIALVLTFILAYMLLADAMVPREFFILYGFVIGSYFELPSSRHVNLD